MKLNNKGISLVEIVISISIISVVVVFLFSLFVSARKDEKEEKNTHNMKINQAILTREINSDFLERELIGLESCADNLKRENDGVKKLIKTPNTDFNNMNCLKFIYNSAKGDDNVGYLIYYTYKDNKGNNINTVTYLRGLKQVKRETNMPPSEDGSALYKCSLGACIVSINMDIYDNDHNNFPIELSYITNESFKVDKKYGDQIYKFNIN